MCEHHLSLSLVVRVHMALDGMSYEFCSLLAHLDVCVHRDGEVGTTGVLPIHAGGPLFPVPIVGQCPHHKVLVMSDLVDGDGGEVQQQLVLLRRARVQVYPGCLGELHNVTEVYRTALDVIELCTEEQRILALQKPVDSATGVHSFHATFFPQSNPLADLSDVEEDSLRRDRLPAVVQDIVQDFQCLQRPCNVDTHNDTLSLVHALNRVACITHKYYCF